MWITRLLCLVIPVLIAGVLWSALGTADQRQHFLGQSTHARATIVEEAVNGRCRGGSGDPVRPRHDYTLEWSEGGEQRTEVIERCGSPYEVGEDVEIWSTDGMPHTESAVVWRLTIIGLVIALSGLFALMVWVHVFVRRMARS